MIAAFVLVGLAAPGVPSVHANQTRDALLTAPHAQFSFDAGLQRLLTGWPLLGRLKGLARVELSTLADEGVHKLLRITCPDTRLGGLELGELTIELFTAAGADRSELALRLEGPAGRADVIMRVPAHLDPKKLSLKWGAGPVQAQIKLRKVSLAHLTKVWPVLALEGSVDLSMKIGGAVEKPRLFITAVAKELAWRGEKLGDARLRLEHERHKAVVELEVGVAEEPRFTARLLLPMRVDVRRGKVRWLDAGEHTVTFAAESLSAEELRPFWKAPHGTVLNLNLAGSGQGSLDKFLLTATLEGEYQAPGLPAVPVAASLEARPSRQDVELHLGDGMLDVSAAIGVRLARVWRQGRSVGSARFTGELETQLPLAQLGAIAPGLVVSLNGTLGGRIVWDGSLEAPKLWGRLETHGAEATLLPLNRRVHDAALSLRFKGDTITVEKLEASSRPGKLSGTGWARLAPAPRENDADAGVWRAWRLNGEFGVDFKKFPLVQPGFPVGAMDGRVAARFDAGPLEADTQVELAGFKVDFTEEELPETRAVPSNRAVRLLDWLERLDTAHSILAGQGRMRLELKLVEPAVVKGKDSDFSIAGTMVVDRQGDVIRVDRGFGVLPGGRFQLFGNEFVVTGGTATLAEGHLGRGAEVGPGDGAGGPLGDPDKAPEAAPLQPVVDLVARGKVVDTHVLVKVKGAAHRPQLVMMSVPSLPEYQILSLLILGRVEAGDQRGGEVRRQAAKLVERFHNPSLGRQFFDRLGVDNLGMGFVSSVSQPVVTVGKQVTRRLYVETVYHHNAPPTANGREGHIEYRLGRQWTVDTVFGDAAEGGFGLFWATDFGGPEPPPPPERGWGTANVKKRPDTDGDGVADPFDLCREQPEDEDRFADDDGCPDFDNDGDGIPDLADAEPGKPETANGYQDDDGAPDVAPPGLHNPAGNFRAVRFPTNSYRLTGEAREQLRAAIALLAELGEVNVQLTGHSDRTGGRRVNRRMSQLRADAVKRYLTAAGLSWAAVEAEGRGFDEPLDESDTEEGRAANRRVEFKFPGKSQP